MDDDVWRISLQIKSKLDLKEVLTTSDTSPSLHRYSVSIIERKTVIFTRRKMEVSRIY